MYKPAAPRSLISSPPGEAAATGPEPGRCAVAHYRELDQRWHELRSHLRGTGILTRRFARKIGLQNLGELMGLLHDLGKYSSAFQNYLLSAVNYLDPDADEYVDARSKKGHIDHSSAGAQVAWRTLAPRRGVSQLVGQWVALCVASHHSGLIDCITPDGHDRFTERIEKPESSTHVAEAEQRADPDVMDRIRRLLDSPCLLEEVTQLIDRIRQRARTHKLTGTPFSHMQLGLAIRFTFSCLIAGDRIDTVHFTNPTGIRFRQGGRYHYWNELIDRLEAHLVSMPTRHAIDVRRHEISDACRNAARRPTGIYTLSVPTGGGKTLASLRFALHHAAHHRLDRIIYIIPYTSIIDQNAQVVRKVMETATPPGNARRIVLEHHSNLGAEQQTYADKLLCDDWDAPIVYTTMVQFLEALFGSGTRGVRRMHQLANSVLVFDEIQTVPLRCLHVFNQALNFLVQEGNSSAVLCTATQPLLHRVSAEKGALMLAPDAELMPDADALFKAMKRVEVHDERKGGGWSDAELADLAIKALQEEGSCLVIVNTKKAARRLYQLASSQIDTDDVFHLSTDMCAAHRKAVLKKVIDRLKTPRRRVLCISTQLIEAGVDVDFRVVIRFLAGLDSIAQAAGRCNRHGGPRPGHVYVVNPENENLDMLPDIAKGREQAQLILDRYKRDPASYDDNILGRRTMQEYYEHYFFQRKEEMSYSLSKEKFYGATLLELLSTQDTARKNYSRQQKAQPPYPLLHAHMSAARAFKAIDTLTEAVIVPYSEKGKALIEDLHGQFDAADSGPSDLDTTRELLQRAQQFTVNVHPTTLNQLMSKRAVSVLGSSGIYCLDEAFYDRNLGLSNDLVNRMETMTW